MWVRVYLQMFLLSATPDVILLPRRESYSHSVIQSYIHTTVTLLPRTESYNLKIRSDMGVTALCILYCNVQYSKLY